MLALRCIELGALYSPVTGSIWVLNDIYPVWEAAERDPLTGQEELRWVRINNVYGTQRTLSRYPDGTYREYGPGARFELTLDGGEHAPENP